MIQELENFVKNPNSHVCYLGGPTGSGKTTMVMNYFKERNDLRTIFLHPRRQSLQSFSKYSNVMTIQSFVRKFVLPRHVLTLDVLILDEFHVESMEWLVLLNSIASEWWPWKKLLVLSATCSDYHFELLENYTKISRDRFTVMTLTIANPKQMTIEYVHEENQWHGFISPMGMSVLIQQQLQRIGTVKRVLVFLQSPMVCENVAEVLKTYPWIMERFEIVTVHGQQESNEIQEVIQAKAWSKPQLILSTNILETSVTLIDLDTVLDFGICYAKDVMDVLAQRYCSQSEMIQRAGRTGRVCDGRVIRFMSEEFYNQLPYVIPHGIEWKSFLLECALGKSLTNLFQIFKESPFLHEMQQDLQMLQSWSLMDDCQNVKYDATEISHLLKGPFAVQQYVPLLTIKKCTRRWSMEQKVLVSLFVSILDFIERYGMERLFYISVAKMDRSYRSVYNDWKSFLTEIYIQVHQDDNRRMIYFEYMELVMNVILSDNGKRKYHINNRMWKQLWCRWRHAWYMLQDASIPFGQEITPLLRSMCFSKSWIFENKKYGYRRFVQSVRELNNIPEKESVKGVWYGIKSEERNKFLQKIWNVSVATWTCDFPISSYGIQIPELNVGVYERFPCPNSIYHHYSNLDICIKEKAEKRRFEYEEQCLWKSFYTEEVVDQLKNDVAFRPGMVEYLKCMDHFHSMVDRDS